MKDGIIACSHSQLISLGTASYTTLFKNLIVNSADCGALNEVTEQYGFGYRSKYVTTVKKSHLPKIIDNQKSTKIPLRPGWTGCAQTQRNILKDTENLIFCISFLFSCFQVDFSS